MICRYFRQRKGKSHSAAGGLGTQCIHQQYDSVNCSRSDLHHLTLDHCVVNSASLFFPEIAFVSLFGCSRMYTNHCPVNALTTNPSACFLPTLWDERVWMWMWPHPPLIALVLKPNLPRCTQSRLWMLLPSQATSPLPLIQIYLVTKATDSGYPDFTASIFL